MLFFIAILIYYFLVILKRIFKPRIVPRLHEYNIENNLIFTIICIGYIAYKLLIQNMTLEQFGDFILAQGNQFITYTISTILFILYICYKHIMYVIVAMIVLFGLWIIFKKMKDKFSH